MIAIVDYGLGNLHSAAKAFEKIGCDAFLTDEPHRLAEADAVVLPGVGAYGDCYRGLEERGLVEPVREAAASGKPFLGICVGFQLMFEGSEEGPFEGGLGIFKGWVRRFRPEPGSGLKVPHMGWNEVSAPTGRECPLLAPGECSHFYFVHSYYADPADPEIVLGECVYGHPFPAIIGRGNVFACQFHPEKSQSAGLALLKRFGDLAGTRGREVCA